MCANTGGDLPDLMTTQLVLLRTLIMIETADSNQL